MTTRLLTDDTDDRAWVESPSVGPRTTTKTVSPLLGRRQQGVGQSSGWHVRTQSGSHRSDHYSSVLDHHLPTPLPGSRLPDTDTQEARADTSDLSSRY